MKENNILNIIGLSFNLLFLLFIIVVIVSYQSKFDIVKLSDDYFIIDLIFGIIGFTGLFISPTLLIINLFKNKKNKIEILILPLIISSIIYFISALCFSIKFNISGIRIFLVPIIIFIIYTLLIIIKFILIKRYDK